jgi:large conductance mechanosensitive channel
MLNDFKAFLLRGNIIDLAVAVVIGGAFGAVVTSLVTNILTPLLAIPGKVDFSAQELQIGGGIIKYGKFINDVIAFVMIAAAIYFFVVRPVARLSSLRAKPGEPATKDCPECLSTIPIAARRCAHCTSPQS